MKTGSETITAVIATLNEARHIRGCIEGLLAQTGVNLVEVLVVDGGSQDGTPEIVQRLPEFGTKVFLLRNPKRFQVYAWNIGIAAARGQYTAFFIGHARYAPDYLRQCLEARKRTGAANVGGVQVPAYDGGACAPAIAWAMSSRFGVGGANLRYAREECFVDSVFCGFYETSLLRDLGGFDERIPFDEDDDLNYRVRKAGHKVLVSPRIRVSYYVRSSLSGLAKQMFRYGFWRRATQLKHPDLVPWRILVPPLFVVALCASALALVLRNPLGLVVPLAYLAFCAAALFEAYTRLRSSRALLAPVVLSVMHVSYGVGYLFGLFGLRGSTFRSEFANRFSLQRPS